MKITGRSWGLPCYLTEQAWVLLAFESILDGGGLDDFPCTYLPLVNSYPTCRFTQNMTFLQRIPSDRDMILAACFQFPVACKLYVLNNCKGACFANSLHCAPLSLLYLELALAVSESRTSFRPCQMLVPAALAEIRVILRSSYR